MPPSAFVVGQWVRGAKFYGRRALLDEILEGPRNSIWLLGTRRIGKTSMLKQLEFLTADPEKSGFCPIFWDFQGAEDLVAVVSGVAIKKRWESEGSPWYNFFEEIQVRPFRQDDARELIEKPIRGIFKLEKGVVDRIIERTEGKPYHIQRVCVALVNRLHEEKRRTVTLADVEAVAQSLEARA